MSLLAKLVSRQSVLSLPPTATIIEAAEKMASKNFGSVIVIENNKIVGIFTERDLLMRVVSKKIDINRTTLNDVMSKNICTISADENVQQALKKMQATKCRRLPIIDEKGVVGMVSMRDILEWLVSEMEDENIQLKEYIHS